MKGQLVVAAILAVASVAAAPSTRASAHLPRRPSPPVKWSSTDTSSRSRRAADVTCLGCDPAWLLEGTTAEQAAVADGVLPSGAPVPNDHYTRDESHKLLTFVVTRTARVTVLTRGPRFDAGGSCRVRGASGGAQPEAPPALRPTRGVGVLGARKHRPCALARRAVPPLDVRFPPAPSSSPRSHRAPTPTSRFRISGLIQTWYFNGDWHDPFVRAIQRTTGTISVDEPRHGACRRGGCRVARGGRGRGARGAPRSPGRPGNSRSSPA